MSLLDHLFPKDSQGNPLSDTDWGFKAEKDITFAGATTNGIGDHDGTGDPFTIFTVTGTVLLRILAVVQTTLTIDATATLEIGIAGDIAKLIAQTAGDAPDVGEIWHDATPDAKIEASSVLTENILAGGSDIIGTVATANINTGKIKFIALFYPLSKDGKVVAA